MNVKKVYKKRNKGDQGMRARGKHVSTRKFHGKIEEEW